MELQLHGKAIPFDGRECGLYMPTDGGMSMDYAIMSPPDMLRTLNGVPREQVINVMTILRDQATEQVGWKEAPRNIGYPLVVRNPPPQPIEEVRPYLENSRRLAEDVLKILQGTE